VTITFKSWSNRSVFSLFFFHCDASNKSVMLQSLPFSALVEAAFLSEIGPKIPIGGSGLHPDNISSPEKGPIYRQHCFGGI